MVRCFVYWMAADMPSMERTAGELLRYAQQRDLPESTIWAQYFHGCACYQQNDLEAAHDSFLAVMQSQHIAPGFIAIQGPIGLALVLQAQGQGDAAAAAVTAVLEYAQQTNNDAAREAGLAFGAALALRQGRMDDASQWTAGVGRVAHGFVATSVVALFAPPLAIAAILLKHGTRAALDEAEQMLTQLEVYLAGMHADRFYVEALALQALLYAQQGRRAEALQTLEHAITVAQPGRLQRVFLDLDDGIRVLLAELNLAGERGAFVRQLCAAVDGTTATPALNTVPQGEEVSSARAPAAPVTVRGCIVLDPGAAAAPRSARAVDQPGVGSAAAACAAADKQGNRAGARHFNRDGQAAHDQLVSQAACREPARSHFAGARDGFPDRNTVPAIVPGVAAAPAGSTGGGVFCGVFCSRFEAAKDQAAVMATHGKRV